MSKLFETTVIKSLELKNRLVRSATWEGMCNPDGSPSERLINCYKDLAAGGVGLIITGYSYVREEGKQLPGKMGIHADYLEKPMRTLLREVHASGGKLVIQLVHAGGQTDTRNAGRRPLAPSSVDVPQFPEIPEELSQNEISDIVESFGLAAARAKSWGFDGVQLHGAHGYLINQFLSPLTNRRTDRYGGDIKNRVRFLLEVYEAVRGTTGDEYPVMIKLNGADFQEGGLTLDDALYAARALDSLGIDAIEVSGGTPASGEQGPVRTKIRRPEDEAYNLPLARAVKEAVKAPVMVVGGIRSYEKAVSIVEEGIDYISLSRPLIREPHLPNRWKGGDHNPARCISCNKCFKPGIKEGGIYCVVEKKEQEKGKKHRR